VRQALAFLLILEAIVTEIWIAGLLPSLAAYDAVVLVLVVARAIIAAALFMGGWLLLNQRPAAAPIAGPALLVSAGLMTVEIGFRMAPSNLDPTFRWPVVGLYWVYALVASWYLRRQS
jgi:hypothetical protein